MKTFKQFYMKNKDSKLIWESYEDTSVARMQGDEHNPPDMDDYPVDRSGQVDNAMNEHERYVRIAGMFSDNHSDQTIKDALHVIETLDSMDEDERARYFGGELGSPF